MIASLVVQTLQNVDPNLVLYIPDHEGNPQPLCAIVDLSFSEVTPTGVTRHRGIALLSEKQLQNLRPVEQEGRQLEEDGWGCSD